MKFTHYSDNFNALVDSCKKCKKYIDPFVMLPAAGDARSNHNVGRHDCQLDTYA